MHCRFTKEIGAFVATEPTGREHTIVVFQEFIESKLLDATTSIIPTVKSLRTLDGNSVNRFEKGRYAIEGDPTINVTSTDPAAP
jgi:hypothetical protein